MTDGIKAAPGECPECGGDRLHRLRLMADERTKTFCESCGYKRLSNFAARELSPGATCHDYDCHGDLKLIEPELYRCVECGRYQGLATTSKSRVYPCPICPLCLTSEPRNVDFHHWEYENDTGVYICRSCHNRIHDGKRASKQSRDQPGNETWHVAAASNLMAIHEDIHGNPESWRAFADRYNLPVEDPRYADIDLGDS